MKQTIIATCMLFFSVCSYGQQAQGFFLNDHAVKVAEIPAFVEVEKSPDAPTVNVAIDVAEAIAPVSKYLYGNNANIFMTQMSNQPVLISHIKELSPNVLRFPGGNLSSVFFWNADKDVPPADAPVKLLDAAGVAQDPGYWYGNNNEEWTMSLENYYKMLALTNTTGIITINYAYARYSTAENPVASAAHHAAEWVRHDNGRTKFWEIGNESNGTWQAGYRIKTADNKDGQPEIITGDIYGKHFKVFADSMRKAASEIGATIYIGAQLLQEEPANWWNATDKNWNTGVLNASLNAPDYYIIHSYYTPFQTNSSVPEILNSATTVTRSMREVVDKYVKASGVTPKPLALTEWNIFAEGSKQQASAINGIHAALVLGELIQNNYGIACRWDLANAWGNGNDHGLFSQGDAPNDPKWNPRAAYYYMYYFQKYFGDTMVKSVVTGSNDVVSYASTFSGKEAGLVIVNKGTSAKTISVNLTNYGFGDRYYFHTLTPGTDNGNFSLKVLVNGKTGVFSAGGPLNFKTIAAQSSSIGSGIKMVVPARGVSYLLVEHGDKIITGVKEAETNVTVFPNPAADQIIVSFPEATFEVISLNDLSGKRMFESILQNNQSEIRIQAPLKSGVYLVSLKGLRSQIIRKIIIAP